MAPTPSFRHPDRRAFLRTAGTAAAGALFLPEALLADAYAPLERLSRRGEPVRVRGRVMGGGRGLSGVSVSDGLDVVATGADGRFELVTTADRDFVSVTVPPGHAIPRSETGTAAFYRPLRPDGRGEMDAFFELEPLAASDERHSMLVLADPQTQVPMEMEWMHEQTVPDVQETLQGLEGEVFGVACGDIMYDELGLYPEYERAVSRMGIPFWQVVGNHDLDQERPTDEGSTTTFTGRFGPRWYSFERGAVHYVVLDDVFWYGDGYIGYLDQEQLRWLANDLAMVEPGRTVIVACHIPVLGNRHVREGVDSPDVAAAIANRQALYRLLEPFHAHVVVGHTHESEHVFEGGVHEHVCGAVCGAWWTGPICRDGTPNGYQVYTVDGEDVRWRYKSTGRPADHQMRLYAPGADPSAPDEVVANVWDWDPEWRVVWYEDGERKGPMARRVGFDPLSVELHAGPDLPERRGWVNPVPVAHMFYAPVAPGAREIRVEATDRFGRVYSEVVRLG